MSIRKGAKTQYKELFASRLKKATDGVGPQSRRQGLAPTSSDQLTRR